MRKLAVLLASLLIVANGCVISPRRTVGSTTGSGGGNSEFSVSANPTSQIITAGASATYTISISAVNGFTGTVSLSASSSNSNIVATFDNTTISGGSGSAVLTVSTTSATPAGMSPSPLRPQTQRRMPLKMFLLPPLFRARLPPLAQSSLPKVLLLLKQGA